MWYLLRYRLSKHYPTLFVFGDSVRFFFKNEVFEPVAGEDSTTLKIEIAHAASPTLIWALINLKDIKSGPPQLAMSPGVFPIQTAFPDPVRYKAWVTVSWQLQDGGSMRWQLFYLASPGDYLYHESLDP